MGVSDHVLSSPETRTTDASDHDLSSLGTRTRICEGNESRCLVMMQNMLESLLVSLVDNASRGTHCCIERERQIERCAQRRLCCINLQSHIQMLSFSLI